MVPQRWRQPHEVRHRLDKKADRNRDAFVDEEEIGHFLGSVLTAVAIIPLTPLEWPSPLPTKQDIFAYIDLNGDGSLRENELLESVEMFIESLNENRRIDDADVEQIFAHLFRGNYLPIEPCLVSSPLEERLDLNRDGTVNVEEAWQFYNRLFTLAGLA